MILYNEKINRSEYPLVFLKTDSGKRIPQLVSTIVENNVHIPDHKNGMCNVRAMVVCTKGIIKGEFKCYIDGQTIYLPDGEVLPFKVLSFEPVSPYVDNVGYATFTCTAHYE